MTEPHTGDELLGTAQRSPEPHRLGLFEPQPSTFGPNLATAPLPPGASPAGMAVGHPEGAGGGRAAGWTPSLLDHEDPRSLASRSHARRLAARAVDARELHILDAYADWFQERFPEGATFATLTYSDKAGHKHNAYSPKACFRDVHKWLKLLNYGGESVWVCEPHRWRDILHLHGVMGPLSPERNNEAFTLWLRTRGRCQLRVATPGAIPYVCKYAFKNGGQDYLDLSRLRRPR